MVEKVKACYIFQVDGNGTKYYIDFKDGEGQVGEGDVPNKPADFKPEVKITMSEDNMLKMFNRKLLFKIVRIDIVFNIENCRNCVRKIQPTFGLYCSETIPQISNIIFNFPSCFTD